MDGGLSRVRRKFPHVPTFLERETESESVKTNFRGGNGMRLCARGKQVDVETGKGDAASFSSSKGPFLSRPNGCLDLPSPVDYPRSRRLVHKHRLSERPRGIRYLSRRPILYPDSRSIPDHFFPVPLSWH